MEGKIHPLSSIVACPICRLAGVCERFRNYEYLFVDSANLPCISNQNSQGLLQKCQSLRLAYENGPHPRPLLLHIRGLPTAALSAFVIYRRQSAIQSKTNQPTDGWDGNQ